MCDFKSYSNGSLLKRLKELNKILSEYDKRVKFILSVTNKQIDFLLDEASLSRYGNERCRGVAWLCEEQKRFRTAMLSIQEAAGKEIEAWQVEMGVLNFLEEREMIARELRDRHIFVFKNEPIENLGFTSFTTCSLKSRGYFLIEDLTSCNSFDELFRIPHFGIKRLKRMLEKIHEKNFTFAYERKK